MENFLPRERCSGAHCAVLSPVLRFENSREKTKVLSTDSNLGGAGGGQCGCPAAASPALSPRGLTPTPALPQFPRLVMNKEEAFLSATPLVFPVPSHPEPSEAGAPGCRALGAARPRASVGFRGRPWAPVGVHHRPPRASFGRVACLCSSACRPRGSVHRGVCDGRRKMSSLRSVLPALVPRQRAGLPARRAEDSRALAPREQHVR